MNFATKAPRTQVLVWLIWLIALFASFAWGQPACQGDVQTDDTLLLGIVTHDKRDGRLFPWQPCYRWKKRALQKYRAWRQVYRRAKRVAFLARLALSGMLSMAQVVDWLTASQLRYKLGALPVLYALLETLNVRHIINQHCHTRAEVDHGTVALVLVLNRLMLPLPLYQVADWVGQTVLVAVLGIAATKFNDDRLGRTLDALYPHLETIWLEVVETALLKADIDLSVIFYDLTAFIVHGRYADSDIIDFGFAHNTPLNKRKFKMSLNTAADGNIPWFYQLLSGRTADQATVQSNMDNLAQWLQRHGYQLSSTLLVGDRTERQFRDQCESDLDRAVSASMAQYRQPTAEPYISLSARDHEIARGQFLHDRAAVLRNTARPARSRKLQPHGASEPCAGRGGRNSVRRTDLRKRKGDGALRASGSDRRPAWCHG